MYGVSILQTFRGHYVEVIYSYSYLIYSPKHVIVIKHDVKIWE